MACSVFSCSSPAGRHSHHSMSNGGLTIRCHIHKLLSHSKWPVQCDSFPQQWEKQHHSYSFHFHIFNNKKQTLIKACRAAKGGGGGGGGCFKGILFCSRWWKESPPPSLPPPLYLTGWNWLGSFLSVCEVASGWKCARLLAPIKIWGNSI